MKNQTILNLGGFVTLNPIQIMDEDIYASVMDIIEANPSLYKTDQFSAFNQNAPANFVMDPVHTKERPIIIDRNHFALLWCDRDDPTNADLMAGMLFEVVPQADKTLKKIPCGIIVGDQFQGVMQYRCSCCGTNETGFSMMFFLMDEDDKITFTTRDTLATEAVKRRFFENAPAGVTVSSAEIKHILLHNGNTGHNCGHDHSQLPRRIEGQKPQPV